MNTEKMIPIDFPRNITPFVPGDVYYNNFVDAEFTMDQRDADIFNNADPRGEFNTYFIVSFANRPSTKGNQPVDDDVVVDAYYESEWNEHPAGFLDWACNGELSAYLISKWKPNHAAMLAKFKEQGANTMNEQEHKAKSHEVALMTEALDDNPDEQVKEPESMIASSEFYQSNNPQVIEPYVADQLDDLINPVSEGCQAVVNTDLHTPKPADELTQDQALKKLIFACDGLSHEFREENYGEAKRWMRHVDSAYSDYENVEPLVAPDKPVFTQEMADSGGKPKATMECLIFNTLLDNPKYEKVVIDFIGEWCCVYTSESCRERSASVDDLLFKPIDNRTDKEKTSCALWDCIEQNDGDLNESSIDAFRSDLLSKFTITLNK